MKALRRPAAHPRTDTPWWRTAVIYQIYIRSFADADGDGIGDIAGIRERLPYLRDLGIDAVWITPWYPSPMADGGYDVADYCDIDPLFGTLADADALIADAHATGIRVLIDIVPNHTSSEHAWFRAALAAGPGSAERERYLFRDGLGEGGALPPNDWRSAFGGPAWTRVMEPDGRPGEWYLHLFDPGQPDLNWADLEVRRLFETILRFWLDRGVDGFRIDVAHGLAKDPLLPALGVTDLATAVLPDPHPHWDRDDVHDIYRGWRRVADEYPGDRVFVAEAWVASPERVVRYLRPDELHTVFNFDFLDSAWAASALLDVIETTTEIYGTVDAPPIWVLSNHDVPRHVTRYGRAHTGLEPGRVGPEPTDLDLGTRRARAGLLLMLALPGGVYLYQGEELGLWEVENLPEEVLQDPNWRRSGYKIRGRDGCRVPLPWSGESPPFGFGPPGSTPWLPQPAAWRSYTAETQAGDPESMLELYRAALRIRREEPGFAAGPMRWLDGMPGALVFERGPDLACAFNLSGGPIDLPGGNVLLASIPLEARRLPVDGAAWIRRS
jgi:alpha-glucosidase